MQKELRRKKDQVINLTVRVRKKFSQDIHVYVYIYLAKLVWLIH